MDFIIAEIARNTDITVTCACCGAEVAPGYSIIDNAVAGDDAHDGVNSGEICDGCVERADEALWIDDNADAIAEAEFMAAFDEWAGWPWKAPAAA